MQCVLNLNSISDIFLPRSLFPPSLFVLRPRFRTRALVHSTSTCIFLYWDLVFVQGLTYIAFPLCLFVLRPSFCTRAQVHNIPLVSFCAETRFLYQGSSTSTFHSQFIPFSIPFTSFIMHKTRLKSASETQGKCKTCKSDIPSSEEVFLCVACDCIHHLTTSCTGFSETAIAGLKEFGKNVLHVCNRCVERNSHEELLNLSENKEKHQRQESALSSIQAEISEIKKTVEQLKVSAQEKPQQPPPKPKVADPPPKNIELDGIRLRGIPDQAGRARTIVFKVATKWDKRLILSSVAKLKTYKEKVFLSREFQSFSEQLWCVSKRLRGHCWVLKTWRRSNCYKTFSSAPETAIATEHSRRCHDKSWTGQLQLSSMLHL